MELRDNYSHIIKRFPKKKVLVIGDIMLDKYIYGKVNRISPEAPIPVVEVSHEKYMPGGAGNTAANLASLNAHTYLIGVTGKDETAKILEKELNARNINFYAFAEDRVTNQKTRIIGEKQQIVRIDRECTGYISKKNETKIIKKFDSLIQDLDAIIISDYAKGCITESLASYIIQKSDEKNKNVIVDPRPQHKNFYKNAFLITPNDKESYEMTFEKNIYERGGNLCNELNSNILLTLGERGMILFENLGDIITEFPAYAKEVFDVSGAGDTVVATIALALASDATLIEAAEIANYAAGIVVGKIGTVPIKFEELLNNFK